MRLALCPMPLLPLNEGNFDIANAVLNAELPAIRRRYLVGLGSPLPSINELMRCLRIAEGLNTITRRGEIGTSLPVFGLRPIRWPFLRTTNEPNDESFTVSPRSKQSVISFKTNSTSEDDSVRERPTFW